VQRLRVVPELTARASSGAFALFVGAVLTVGLLGLLALNTLLTQGSFASTDLGQKKSALVDQEQALQREVAVLESPATLAQAARELGMVATVNPAFIDPKTGRVLGVPVAGRAAPKPAPSPSAAATPAATATPAAGVAPAASTAPSPGATTVAKPTATPGTTASPGPTASAGPTAAPKPGTAAATATR
jgi:hypothetical protein